MVELEPDGLFLSFTRFPGFWENWVPGYAFSNMDRFCFCARCRSQFARDQDLDLPDGDAAEQAREILARHGPAWTAWRSARIVDAITQITNALTADGVRPEIMLNTLAFPASDFGPVECSAFARFVSILIVVPSSSLLSLRLEGAGAHGS